MEKAGVGVVKGLLRTIEGLDGLKPVFGNLFSLAALLPRIVKEAGKIVDGIEEGEDKLLITADEVGKRVMAAVDGLWESEEGVISLVERLGEVTARVASDPTLKSALESVGRRAGQAADAAIERAAGLSQAELEGPARSLAIAEVILQRILERAASNAFD